MNVFTQAVWKVIKEDEELLAELRLILRQDHLFCLNAAQAFEANTHLLTERILARFRRWLDWLPTLPTSLIGLALAEEAMKAVQWPLLAEKVREGVVS